MTALTHHELPASSSIQEAPRYPAQHWLWGSLRTFFADPITLLSQLPQTYPDLVQLRLGPLQHISVSYTHLTLPTSDLV